VILPLGGLFACGLLLNPQYRKVKCFAMKVLSGDSPDSHWFGRQVSGGVAQHHLRARPFSTTRLRWISKEPISLPSAHLRLEARGKPTGYPTSC